MSGPLSLLQHHRHATNRSWPAAIRIVAKPSQRSFSQSPRLSHLEQTVHAPREDAPTWATISNISQLTPTTVGLQLAMDDSVDALPITFAPGQWVDFFIPGVDTVGGYSITSLPSELPTMHLAVKASAHPPALWCTSRAKVGDRIGLRVGGNFVLHESAEAHLFVAGGVGINPLWSMLQSVCEQPDNLAKAAMLYMARSREELLFASELAAAACAHPSRIRLWLYATRDALDAVPVPVPAAPGVVGYATGRAGEAELEVALRWLGCKPCKVRQGRGVPWRPDSIAREAGTQGEGCARLGAYVCGPPAMTDEVAAVLRRMGVANVFHEKWW